MEKDDIYEFLKQVVGESNIYVDESMKNHTSFKIGGNADFLVKINKVEYIKPILEFSSKNKINITIIGNGSNLLVKDNGIRGIVLKIDLKDIKIEKEDNKAIITVGAGALLGKLAQELFKNSITGFEFASGIPGTIGGAITMNAGAYGSEFKNIVIQTLYMDMNGNMYIIDNNEHNFEYRYSYFKEKECIILETKLRLEYTQNQECIKQKMDELLQQRKEKQPINMPSAGSTFKRGNDFITAKLIDECGLKGFSIGDAQVSTTHAGFIINKGNASAKDVLDLIQYVKQEIKRRFDKEIEIEICVIGE